MPVRSPHVTDALLPRTPAPRPGSAAVVVALVVGCTAWSLLRQAGAPAVDTMWAEDGGIFLNGAYRRPLGEALVRPYGGYLLLLPRLVAELAALLPVGWAAVVMAGSAALLTAAAAAVVWVAAGSHVPSGTARLALALVVVAQPAALAESLNSMALVQWHLAVAAFWVVLWRPRTALGRAIAAGAVLLTGLTTPLVLALVPVALLRLLALPAGERLPGWLVLGTAAVQGALLATAAGAATGSQAPVEVAAGFAQRVAAVTVLGRSGAEAAWLAAGWSGIAAALLLLGWLLVLAVASADAGGRVVALLSLATAGASFALGVAGRGLAGEVVWPAGEVHVTESRYAVPAVLLVLSAVAVGLGGRRPQGVGKVAGALALSVLAVTALVDLRGENLRSAGPRWSDQVAAATATCRSDEAQPEARLAIAPQGLGWAVVVPCDRLRRGGPAPVGHTDHP